MRGTRSVCLLCRHRLATTTATSTSALTSASASASEITTSGAPRSGQRQTRARFTTSTVRHDDTNTHNTHNTHTRASTVVRPHPSDPAIAAIDSTSNSRSGHVRKTLTAGDRKWNGAKSQPSKGLSKRPPPPRSPASSSRVEAMFQQIVVQQRDAAQKQARSPDNIPAADHFDWEMEKKAKELFDIHTKSSVETTYNYLKTEIYPILRRPHVTISPFLHVTVANVLKKLTAAKKLI